MALLFGGLFAAASPARADLRLMPQPIILTCGEPAGIGPELAPQALAAGVPVVWMGDPAHLPPGTPWRPGSSEGASSCTHTYRSSSATRPGGTFNLEATVTLEVSWTSNAAGGGALPAITRSSTLDVEVGEIQAIGTRGGR